MAKAARADRVLWVSRRLALGHVRAVAPGANTAIGCFGRTICRVFPGDGARGDRLNIGRFYQPKFRTLYLIAMAFCHCYF